MPKKAGDERKPTTKKTGKKTKQSTKPKAATAKTAKKAAKKTAPKKSVAKGTAAEKPAVRKAAAKRRPAAAAKKPPASVSSSRLRVRQVRSGIGRAQTYRRTLRALGLKHHQDEIVVTDSPSTRGMLRKVRHLVHVKAEEA